MPTLYRLQQDILKTRTKLIKRIGAAQMKTAREGVIIARMYSSGWMSKSLAAQRPFAKRHGQPLADPTVINKQTGIFKASWKIKMRQSAFGPPVPVIYNQAPYAHFLESGTRFMFARPVDKRIKADLEPIKQNNIRKALEGLSPNRAAAA